MLTLSRQDVADWSGITLTQLDYLAQAGVVAPDIGDKRKRFSLLEARLAVIAGCAVSNGTNPRSLSGPIGWLRERVAKPDVTLSESFPESILQFEASRIGPLIDDNFPEQNASIRRIMGAWVFAFDNQSDAAGTPYDAMKALFEEAKQSEKQSDKDRVTSAERRARSLLSQHQSWPIETFRQIERSLDFELACRGKRDLFFQMTARAEDWKTYLSQDLSSVDGVPAWLVINIRRLFSERKSMV